MKILQILPEMHAGGVERGTLEVASFLVREGHEAVVVSHGGRMVPQLEAAGVRHLTLPVHRKNPLTLLQVPRLRRLLETERPDILHYRSRVPGWVAWLAWRGMDPARRPRLVSTMHGFHSVSPYSAVMTRGERVIAVSEAMRDHILTHYPRVPPGILRVVPRGIDPARYHPCWQPSAEWLAAWHEDHPRLAGRRLFLLPGRITRLKGHEDLFRLIATLRQQGIDAHGLVAGDTHPKKQAYLAWLRGLLGTLGLEDDITFLGHRSDLREVMAVSDVVCALSQQPESFGRTVLEALALGKPVVGYDGGGVGELLARLFPAGRVALGDAAGLATAARALVEHPRQPAPVVEPFTLDAMCRGTLAVYRELV